jgi:hypothetical protein
MKPINILMYEDNVPYSESFKLKAQQKRILVDVTNNVDNLLEALEASPRKHKFVVLDARAYLHEGQIQGTESEANLHKIFKQIDRIAKIQDRVIPYCVNTGFAEIKLQYNEVLECPIYEKGQEEELIDFIWHTYNESGGAKLRQDFPEPFDFADSYFDDADLEVLSKLLHNNAYKSERIADRIDNLTRLRRLVEHTMDIVFNHHLNQQPGVIRNRSSRASDIINHLNGLGVVPPQIFGSVVNILKTASSFGSHTPEQAEKIQDYPTSNSILSLTFGLFEIFIWAKKLLN